MQPLWQQILHNLGDKLDHELLPNLYEAVGNKTADLRHELVEAGLSYWDPASGREPDANALESSALILIRSASRSAALGGAVAGFAGALAVPPEMATALVGSLRLGQRLAVLYGHDPDTDKGRLLLWRAIAAAWEVDMPRQGGLDLRVSSLPALLRSQLPSKLEAAPFARTLAVRAAVTVGRRTLRLLPGLGAGLGAFDGRRRILAQGARMTLVFANAWEGSFAHDGAISEAVEVRVDRAGRAR